MTGTTSAYGGFSTNLRADECYIISAKAVANVAIPYVNLAGTHWAIQVRDTYDIPISNKKVNVDIVYIKTPKG